MTIGKIMQKLMDMCGISREEALRYMEQKLGKDQT